MKKKKMFQRIMEKIDKNLKDKAKKKSCCSCKMKDAGKNK